MQKHTLYNDQARRRLHSSGGGGTSGALALAGSSRRWPETAEGWPEAADGWPEQLTS